MAEAGDIFPDVKAEVVTVAKSGLLVLSPSSPVEQSQAHRRLRLRK